MAVLSAQPLRGCHQRCLKSYEVAWQEKIQNLAATVRQCLVPERPTVEECEQLGVYLAHVNNFSAGGDRSVIYFYALNEIDLCGGLLNEGALHPQRACAA